MNESGQKIISKPGAQIFGSVSVPGDKSISHRSIILSSIATGKSQVSGFLQGEDSLKTMSAFQAMGVPIERHQDQVMVQGQGMDGLQAASQALELHLHVCRQIWSLTAHRVTLK